jgi:hypothetical protein
MAEGPRVIDGARIADGPRIIEGPREPPIEGREKPRAIPPPPPKLPPPRLKPN